MAWLVPAFGTRPNQSARVAAMLAGDAGCTAACCTERTTLCAGCGRWVAVASPTATVTVNGERVAVASANADRAVMDHPAFRTGGPVAYDRATVIPTCPACNGAPSVRATVLDGLEFAALDRLHRWAVQADGLDG